jgi:hypothetical protein
VAHPAKPSPQNFATDDYVTDCITIKGAYFQLKRNLEGRRYTTTIDKQVMSCEISRPGAEAMGTARNQIFALFKTFEATPQ